MTSFAGLTDPPQRVRVAQRVGASLTTLLRFDASISENHLSELDVTEHPVETGSDITDHLRVRPTTLDMTIIMSNRPIEILATQKPLGIKGGSSLERAEDAFREMLRWQSEGLLLTVVTTLRTYENMVLQRIAPTRDAPSGKILRAALSFREIVTTETQVVDAPDTERPQDRKRKNKGRKPKQAAKTEVESAANDATQEGYLARGINWVFGTG